MNPQSVPLERIHMDKQPFVLAQTIGPQRTHLHVFNRLSHNFLGIFQVLQNIVEVCFGYTGKSVKQVHLETGGRDRGRRDDGTSKEASRRNDRKGRGAGQDAQSSDESNHGGEV